MTTPPPFVLAFDSAGPACCIGSSDPALPGRDVAMERGQAEHLMPLIEAHLAEAGRGWGDVEAIGVGIGPGNFTGVRIAVSAARGLALALGIPAIGISEFELMAAEAREAGHGPALLAFPAQRGLAAAQAMDARGALIGAPKLLPLGTPATDFITLPLFGPAGLAEALGLAALPFPQTRAKGDAIAALALARLQGGGKPPRPAPLYLRPADAAPSSDMPPALIG